MKENLALDRHFKELAKDLSMQYYDSKKMKRSTTSTLRLGAFLIEALDQGLSATQIGHSLLFPDTMKKNDSVLATGETTQKLVQATLQSLRKNLTVKQMATKLHLTNSSSWHHWEIGRRDIPLWFFLKALSLNAPNFRLFLETLNFKKDFILEECSIKYSPGEINLLFQKPWVLTLYLLLQSSFHNQCEQNLISYAQILGVSLSEIEEGLKLLIERNLVVLEQTRYRSVPANFQSLPSFNGEEGVKAVKKFWFDKGYELSQRAGHHRIMAACVSMQSKKKILGWLQEFEKKVFNEIENSAPETVLLMKLQIVDLTEKWRFVDLYYKNLHLNYFDYL